MEISWREMEQLSQAQRPRRAQPLDPLLPRKKWFCPRCLETRDSCWKEQFLCVFTAISFHQVRLNSLFLTISQTIFLCLSVLQVNHPPTFGIDCSEVSCKQAVSRTTEISAFWVTCCSGQLVTCRSTCGTVKGIASTLTWWADLSDRSVL